MSRFRYGAALTVITGAALLVACTAAPAAGPTAPPRAAVTPAAPAATAGPSPQAAAKPPAEPTGRVVFGMFGTCTNCYSVGSVVSGVNALWYWPAYDGLTWIDRTGKLQPGLAREWSTTDARTWTFRLRDDLKFHDGTAFEAADVVGTMEFVRNPQNQMQGFTSFADVVSISAPDKTTVVFQLNKVVPSFPKFISLALVTQGRKVQEQGRSFIVGPAPGTGPFRVARFDQPTNTIEYQAMGASFVSPRGVPGVRDVHLKFILEPATLIAALKSGEVDLATSIPADNVADVRSAGFDIRENTGTASYHYDLNTYSGPTANVKVRQAMNYAVNRELILRSLFGNLGELDGQLIGKEVLGYNPDVKPYPFDLPRARQLIAEGGYPNGFAIRLSVLGPASGPGGSNVAAAVAQDLRAIGVNVELVPQDTAIWLAAFSGRQEQRLDMNYATINWERTFEAESVWRFWSSDRTVETGRRWTDETFDQLYQRAKTTLNEQERGRIYQQAAKYLNENAGALFLWRLYQAVALSRKVDWNPGLYADAHTTQLKLRQ